jgi:hypothetical protein
MSMASITLAAALLAAPAASTGHQVDPQCRRLNHTQTALCEKAITEPGYVLKLFPGHFRLVPAGKYRVASCRSEFTNNRPELTSCLQWAAWLPPSVVFGR